MNKEASRQIMLEVCFARTKKPRTTEVRAGLF